MKKTGFILLAAFLLCSVLLGAGIVWFSATDYKGTETLYPGFDDSQPVSVQLSGDTIEVRDVYAEGNRLHYTVLPVKRGTTVLKMTEARSGRILAFGEVYVLPFGRVIANVSSLDCNGGSAVVFLFLMDLAVTAVFTAASFFLCGKRAAFGYTMINSGGVALFALLSFSALCFSLLSQGQQPLTPGVLLHTVAKSSAVIITVTAPFMTAFAAAVIISNLLLFRREGFYILRLMCVLLAGVWFAGLCVNLLFRQNPGGTGERSALFQAASDTFSAIMGYGICLLLATVAVAWAAAHRKPSYDREYIIILSCAVRRDGSPTPLLQSRADSAVAFEKAQFAKTGKHAVFVATGGKDAHNAQAPSAAVKRCLAAQGIPNEQILTEEKSVSTFQNLLNADEVIRQHGGSGRRVAFATSDYHMLRSYVLAGRVPLPRVRGIAAKTKWVFYPNSVLRELLGLMAQDMHIHAAVVMALSSLVFFASLAARVGV